jgi:LuxR family transcriptional regulator, maltose regulon positive regulatory protein
LKELTTEDVTTLLERNKRTIQTLLTGGSLPAYNCADNKYSVNLQALEQLKQTVDMTGSDDEIPQAGYPFTGIGTTTIPSAMSPVLCKSGLATKLHVPHPRTQLVPRSHLVNRLQQGMAGPLTLVSAPTGFGKTTLLTQWVAEHNIPTAWLSLEPDDNEPVCFFSYLIAALQQLGPLFGKDIVPLLGTPQCVPLHHILIQLINDITNNHPEHFALVLDDYHVITADPIVQAMAFLVEHLPPQMHLVLVTRANPPLPLARLRARGQLCEIRTTDLRFSTEETNAFLSNIMKFVLTPENVADLADHTDGWITGLQLAARALRGQTDISGFLASFSGSHHYVQDYFSQEILADQTPHVQSFLLHTCLLERLSGSLCDAVANQEGSQDLLEQLEQANLFVIPLDNERHRYRYHQLFAEGLQSILQKRYPQLVPELQLRASVWYKQQGLYFEAVQYALAIPNFERAAHLMEHITLMEVGWERIPTVLNWLNQLSDVMVRTSARLDPYHAAWLMFTDQEDAAACLQEVEEALQSAIDTMQQRDLRDQVTLARAILARFVGDLPRYIALSQKAHSRLTEKKAFWHSIAQMHIAQSYLLSGDVRPVIKQQLVDVASEAQATQAELQTSYAEAQKELLTRREHNLLGLLAEGNSNREIAQRLFLSLDTVKKYVSTIYGKLGVRSRTQAIARARALNLI